MELHVWGGNKEIALIDADSLATSWYLSLVVPKDKFIIITSSNTDLSNSGKLPSLRIPEANLSIDGYLDIIRYLSSEGYDLDKNLSKHQRALNKGLLLYIQDNLQVTTDYVLYLNKSNYEQYSRSVFSQYLPFPMQYNTPLSYRSQAKSNCARIGLSIEDKTDLEQEMLKNVPTVSKVQQLKHESLIEEKLMLKNSVSNMRCLNQLQSYLETIMGLKSELNSTDKDTIFDKNDLTSSDLLLLAHLSIITNPILPDQFITTFMNKLFPDMISSKIINLAKVEDSLKDISIRDPYFSESPNIFNAIKHIFV